MNNPSDLDAQHAGGDGASTQGANNGLSEQGADGHTAAERFKRATNARQRGLDAELEIWQGGFSPKAMVGSWVGSAVISTVCIVLMVVIPSLLWLWAILLILPWIAAGLFLTYKKLGVSYRLTSQRFFHESGILRRTVDRIEVIDMDDVQFVQGVFDRILGVGTLRIKSSDTSHPWLVIPGIENVREVAQKLDEARRKERIKRGLHIETV